jgi:hypothetical protein
VATVTGVRRIVLPLLLAPLIAAGCGGGSDHATTGVATSDGPPSKAHYIEVADVICSNHRSRREDLESQARALGAITSSASARRVAGLLRQEADNLRDEARELEGLSPPQEGRAQVEVLIASLRRRALAIDRWATAYERPDEAGIRSGQIRVGVLTAASERAAQAYGFHACGP